ncbi:MAG: FecR domain-containing protein [bacterium]
MLLLCVTACAAHGASASSAEEIEVEIAGSATVVFRPAEESARKHVAVIKRTAGTALLRRSGEVVWENAPAGEKLYNGDALETRQESAAVVEFEDKSYLKISPVSLVIFREAKAEEQPAHLADLQSGKAWGRIEGGDDVTPVVVMTPGGYVDGRKTVIFVEANERSRSACVDVFKGTVNVRPLSMPDQPVALQHHSRATIEADKPPGAVTVITDEPDESDLERSCLTAKEEEPAKAAAPGQGVMVVKTKKGGEIWVEITNYASVSFTSQAPAAEETILTDQDRVILFHAEAAPAEAEETAAAQPEYELIVVTDTTTISFQKPEEEKPAEEPSEAGACVIGSIVIEAVEPAGLDISPASVQAGGSASVAMTTCGAPKIRLEAANVACENAAFDAVQLETGGGAPEIFPAETPIEMSLASPGEFPFTARLLDRSLGAEHPEFNFTLQYTKEVAPPEANLTQVGNTSIEDVFEKLVLYRDSLDGSYLVVRGTAVPAQGCAIAGADVTLDAGSTWQKASDGGAGAFELRFVPSETTYFISARAEDEELRQSEEPVRHLEVEYHHMTEEENLREVFEKLIRAYIDKDTLTFMGITSASFHSTYQGIEDNSLLQESLENKFIAYPAIYLKYQVDTVTVSGAEGRVYFYWTADTAMGGFDYYAVFIFEKETEWAFTSVTDDNTFLRYTSEVHTISLSAAKTVLIADESDSTTISGEVRDSANNLVKDGTVISLSASSGSIPAAATTTNGLVSATYTTGYFPGTVTVTASSSNGVYASITLELLPERADLPPGMK